MKLAHLCMQMCFVFSLGYVNLKAFILRNCIFCLSLAYRASSSFIRSQWGAGRPGTSVPNLRPKLHSPQKGQDVPGTCVGGLTGCHTYHFGGRCHHLPWPLLLPASWKRNWMWGCGQRVWLLVWEGVTKGLSARVKKVDVKNENEIEVKVRHCQYTYSRIREEEQDGGEVKVIWRKHTNTGKEYKGGGL